MAGAWNSESGDLGLNLDPSTDSLAWGKYSMLQFASESGGTNTVLWCKGVGRFHSVMLAVYTERLGFTEPQRFTATKSV